MGNQKYWVEGTPIEEPLRVYENNDGELHSAWTSDETDETTDVAWGDWDGDGDLDLAVANKEEEDRVYRNDGGTLTLAWSSPGSWSTYAIAWGDYDGDDDLDLITGIRNSQASAWTKDRLYENENGVLTLVWTSPEALYTHDVAWADHDGDDDIDLLVGVEDASSYLYENQDGQLLSPPEYLGIYGAHVAWGDWDWDGDPDLVIGGYFGADVLTNTGELLNHFWSGAEEEDETNSIIWGDVDYDGDLDLAVGNAVWSDNQPNRIYLGDGSDPDLWWSSMQTYRTVRR